MIVTRVLKSDYLRKKIARMLLKYVSLQEVRDLIEFFFTIYRLDPLKFAYNRVGVLNYQNFDVSGESFFLRDFVRKRMDVRRKTDKPVFFDVGGHSGSYLKCAKSILGRDISYHFFEPNSAAYNEARAVLENEDTQFNNVMLSSQSGYSKIFIDTGDGQHSSSIQDVVEYFSQNSVQEKEVKAISLDEYCDSFSIDSIDFLKIDVEGMELEVLKGASYLLGNKKIDLIQFEFGECHLYSRVLLRDFYSLLSGYHFYRLNSKSLIPLGDYKVESEIFRFQVIVASKKELT